MPPSRDVPHYPGTESPPLGPIGGEPVAVPTPHAFHCDAEEFRYSREQALISLVLDETQPPELRCICARALIDSEAAVLVPESELVTRILYESDPRVVATLLVLLDAAEHGGGADVGALFALRFSQPNGELRESLVEALLELRQLGERMSPILAAVAYDNPFESWIPRARELSERWLPGAWEACERFARAGVRGEDKGDPPEPVEMQIRLVLTEFRSQTVRYPEVFLKTRHPEEFLLTIPFFVRDEGVAPGDIDSTLGFLHRLYAVPKGTVEALTALADEVSPARRSLLLKHAALHSDLTTTAPVDRLIELAETGTYTEASTAVSAMAEVAGPRTAAASNRIFVSFRKIVADPEASEDLKVHVLAELGIRGRTEGEVFKLFAHVIRSHRATEYLSGAAVEWLGVLVEKASAAGAREIPSASSVPVLDFIVLLARSGTLPGGTHALRCALRTSEVLDAVTGALRSWNVEELSKGVACFGKLRDSEGLEPASRRRLAAALVGARRTIWMKAAPDDHARLDAETTTLAAAFGRPDGWFSRFERELWRMVRKLY